MYNIHGKLEGRTAVITGGASGIGACAAERFAREGAAVVIADVDAVRGEALAEHIRSSGGAARFISADVTEAAEIRALLDAAAEQFGGIDILAANAGIQGPLAPTAEYPPEGFCRVLDIGLTGAFHLCKYGLPYLMEQQGGAIVVTSSLSAFDGSSLAPAYAAAKTALLGLTRSMARDYGKYGIRVNAVCPGSVDTPLTAKIRRSLCSTPEEERRFLDDQLKGYPLGRLGSPEDIAKLMLFLVSDESSYITGDAVIIDGGYWAGYPGL